MLFFIIPIIMFLLSLCGYNILFQENIETAFVFTNLMTTLNTVLLITLYYMIKKKKNGE